MKKCFACCFSKEKFPKSDSQVLQTESDAPDPGPKSPTSSQPSYIQQSLSLNFLISRLHQYYLFRTISESQIKSSIGEIKLITVPENQNIVSQNEIGQKFYLIVSGNCEVLINNKVVDHITSGKCFGEIALITNLKRRSTVRTITKCVLWVLDRVSFKNLTKTVKDHNKNFLLSFLQHSPFFSHLTENDKNKIFELSFFVKFIEGEKICGQGEPSVFLYILKSGLLSVLVDGKPVGELKDGQVFGEASLLCPEYKRRTATVVCLEEADVYMIDLQSLIDVFGPEYKTIFLRNIVLNTLKSDNYTKFIPDDSMTAIVNSFQFTYLAEGSVAINNAQELQTSALIVCFGEISSLKKSYKALSLIGFKNKNYLKVGTGKFKCIKPTIIAKASLTNIKTAIGVDIDFFINKVRSILDLKAARIFNKLNLSELEVLIKSGQRKEYQKNEIIYLESQNDANVYLILAGSVGIYEFENFLFRYDAGSVFGETCVKMESRIKSAKALTDAECLVFSLETIKEILNESVMKYVEHSVYLDTPFDLDGISIKKEYVKSSDRDFYFCESATNKYLYFAEIVYKKKVASESEFLQVVNQNCVLAQLDHPHIPRLLRTLSDHHCVYFFYDLVDFESLSNIISKKVPEPITKFIFLSILTSLDYIHSKGIMHRDVNPNNILIDSKGYAKLVGFKYSKETKRSRTIIDDAIEYKAKEVLSNQMYSKSAELWSCGVILYKMLTGKLPLGLGTCKSPYEAMQKILNFEGKFQAKSLTGAEGEIVRRLLDTDPNKRMDIPSIFKSQWASGYKMDEIFYENYDAEFKPVIKDWRKDEGGKKFEPRKRLTQSERNKSSFYDWDAFF